MITRLTALPLLLSLLTAALGVMVPMAAGVPINLSALGVTSYDSDYIGFGIVLENADLGTLDPSLAGITLTVSTSSPLSPANARAWTSSLQPHPAVARGPVTWTFDFSQPVHGTWTASNPTFGAGEKTTLTGAGTLTPTGPEGWKPGIITTSHSVENPTPTAIAQNFSYGGGAAATWSFTHEDSQGLFGGQSMQFSLTHAPEPTRLLLTLGGLTASLLLRRRPPAKATTIPPIQTSSWMD